MIIVHRHLYLNVLVWLITTWFLTFFFIYSFSGRSIDHLIFSILVFSMTVMQTDAHATRYPTFLWIRSITFSCIIFSCLLWIVLLSIVLFAQWDVMNHTERSLIFVMLVVDTITIIMLPLLLLRSFRPWLDAARFFFLIILHTGIAGLFTYKSYAFQCSSAQSVDQRAVCSLIVLYVIISSWLVTGCIIGYASGLAILFVRLSRLPLTPQADPESLK